MWKYRHCVKENPKSGHNWSATWQRHTAFCVCQREQWECQRPCAQSGRQSKNAPIESWDLMWNCHSLTDCSQNNLSGSPAQLCQTTSRTAVVWNQLRCPTDSLQAAAVRGTVWLHMVWGRKCLPSNHHSTRRTIGFMHQLMTRSDTSTPAVCYACRLWSYGVRCHVTSGYDWNDIFCRPWGEGERPVLLRCLVLLSQQMLPAIKRVTERCFFTKQ